MPPRYVYWTIIVGGAPTAFRAAMRDELLPTFNRIHEKHADAEMKYFAQGKLWNSPEEARARRDAVPAEPRERRGHEWRPGGSHKDPRAQFKKESFWKKQRRERKEADRAGHGNGPHQDEHRPSGAGDKPPAGARPFAGRGDRQNTGWRDRDRPPRTNRPLAPGGDRRPPRPDGDRPARPDSPSRGSRAFGSGRDRDTRPVAPRDQHQARKPGGWRPRDDHGGAPGGGRPPSHGSPDRPVGWRPRGQARPDSEGRAGDRRPTDSKRPDYGQRGGERPLPTGPREDRRDRPRGDERARTSGTPRSPQTRGPSGPRPDHRPQGRTSSDERPRADWRDRSGGGPGRPKANWRDRSDGASRPQRDERGSGSGNHRRPFAPPTGRVRNPEPEARPERPSPDTRRPDRKPSSPPRPPRPRDSRIRPPGPPARGRR